MRSHNDDHTARGAVSYIIIQLRNHIIFEKSIYKPSKKSYNLCTMKSVPIGAL